MLHRPSLEWQFAPYYVDKSQLGETLRSRLSICSYALHACLDVIETENYKRIRTVQKFHRDSP